MSDPDGGMGAGGADATDLEHPAGGDATGGGSPGDPDAMGADDSRTVEEGAGRLADGHTPDPDLQIDDDTAS